MIKRVGSVTLEVPDLDRSVGFFVDKVGLVVTDREDETAYLRSGTDHHDMVLVQSEDGNTALRHLNLEVVDGTFDETLERAVANGGIDLGPVDHAGIERGRLLEIPDGFVVKIYEGISRREVPGPSPVARPIRFSHFNIGVHDVAAHVDFFMAAFGLRPSDWIGSKDDPLIAWLHCPVPGASHHGVAILRSENLRLHHIAFDFENVGAVVARVDNYVDADHYLVWGMGRHGTGGSIFSYIEDPSGVMVELGTGMIIIGDDPRWNGPRVWPLNDRRGVDEWGSSIPDAWLAKHVDVRLARQTTRTT